MNSNKKPLSPQDPRLTAFALGELPKEELAEIRSQIESDPTLRKEVESIRQLAQRLTDELANEPIPAEAAVYCQPVKEKVKSRRRWYKPTFIECAVLVVIVGMLMSLLLPAHQCGRINRSAVYAEEIKKFNEAPVRSYRHETTIVNYPKGDTKKISRVNSSANGYSRTEGTNFFGEKEYTVFDYNAGKRVVFYPDAKAAEIFLIEKSIPKNPVKIPSFDKKSEQDRKKQKPTQPTIGSEAIDERLKQLEKYFSEQGNEVQRELLGKKEINGRMARGYKIHSVPKSGPVVRKRWGEYWFDVETDKPLLIKNVNEHAMQIVIGKDGSARNESLALEDYDETNEKHYKTVYTTETSDFQTDLKFGPSFFSIEIPEGYTVIDRTVEIKPTFKQFCETLKYAAGAEGAPFPKENVFGKYTTHFTSSDGSSSNESATIRRLKSNRTVKSLEFPKFLKPENDWHYVGAGVKLGTKDKAICWYKPDGAKGYTVLYADMSVKTDVKKEALPKIDTVKKDTAEKGDVEIGRLVSFGGQRLLSVAQVVTLGRPTGARHSRRKGFAHEFTVFREDQEVRLLFGWPDFFMRAMQIGPRLIGGA